MEEILDTELSEKEATPPAEEKEDTAEALQEDTEASVDYAELVREDVRALKSEFSELSGLSDITELENPLRYAALRDLGLSPAEAYLATARKQRARDNRSHLYGAPIINSRRSGVIPESEMAAAREIFGGVPDSEIRRLYKKVTK